MNDEFLVRMSGEVFRQLGIYEVDWGEPDEQGIYTPILHREDPLPRIERVLDVYGVKWRDLPGDLALDLMEVAR